MLLVWTRVRLPAAPQLSLLQGVTGHKKAYHTRRGEAGRESRQLASPQAGRQYGQYAVVGAHAKMTDKHQIKTSKFLSLLLRHKPDSIGLTLDENGWADTTELLEKINNDEFNLTIDELKTVVENSDKKRFLFSTDFSKIRANQGHSIIVDLELTEKVPPENLFHGTADKNLKSIKKKGLIKGQRHHIHLSADKETAYKVGQRYGKPIILTIKAGLMHEQGITFYQSENGVWLTDIVSPNFIEYPS